jgi:hypothetical protein
MRRRHRRQKPALDVPQATVWPADPWLAVRIDHAAQEGQMAKDGTTGRWRKLSYDVWCQCARLLLGWAEGDAAEWPALYGAGLTPLQAVRETGFGNPAADLAVWV